ncbi:hypothetical protein LshimejAT787_0502960 [Lyophyllum shimeji]|uniref:Uncharacterized protein n=1 Tax=Lyophyllum shimeji TaxID=47721 RepID=A0A9P3PNA4_LYOSH|nr:hypothetical protein LshimejAT787_0502960 [Lyophyllum shimeji]
MHLDPATWLFTRWQPHNARTCSTDQPCAAWMLRGAVENCLSVWKSDSIHRRITRPLNFLMSKIVPPGQALSWESFLSNGCPRGLNMLARTKDIPWRGIEGVIMVASWGSSLRSPCQTQQLCSECATE